MSNQDPSRALYLEERYRIVPQMKVYDNIRQYFMPYLCQSNTPNYSSDVLETDELGYRKSYWQSKEVSTESWTDFSRKGLLLGGSVALSWGASSDCFTLSSVLAELIDMPVLSLGMMAGHSFHEFIAGAPFYAEADLVISCTGINTFQSSVASPKAFFDLYAPLYPFNTSLFENMRGYDILTLGHLISDDVDPRHFFKSEEQRVLFRDTMRKRLLRRLLYRVGGWQLGQTKQHERRSIEEALDLAVRIQTRDISNIRNACGKVPYLCVLQPFLLSIQKVLSPEEKRLIELAERILRPDWFRMQRDITGKYYPVFVERVKEYCLREKIRCVDLNEEALEGWCFVDSVHLTDHGNREVAKYIAEAL